MLNEYIAQYESGLISQAELQKNIDYLNMGSDTTFITFRIVNGKVIITK